MLWGGKIAILEANANNGNSYPNNLDLKVDAALSVDSQTI